MFIVSIRKDVDDGLFKFPQGYDSGIRLKDMLLGEVEEKYYIENEKTQELLSNLEEQEGVNVSQQGKEVDGITDTAHTLLARDYKGFGNQSMTAVAEPTIVASRGRNPENPSDRTTGSPTEQRLELNEQGTTNTLTTVQKDNWVLEPNELKLHKNLSGGKWDKIHESARRVYDKEGVAPAMHTCGGGNTEPKVAVREATEKGYDVATVGDSINVSFPNSKTRRGRVGKEVAQTLETQSTQAVIEPLTTSNSDSVRKFVESQVYSITDKGRKGLEIGITHKENGDVRPHRMDARKSGLSELNINYEGNESHTVTRAHSPKVYGGTTDYRIRKLSPQECWRLMGFTDEDYWTARTRLEEKFYNGGDRSNSQMYKQAGNSIVVDVLEHLFKNLLGG